MADRPSTAIGGTTPQGEKPTGSMAALVQDGYGTSDVLRLAQIARPVIGPREILIRVRAAGIDRGTWHLMQGKPRLLRLVFGLRAPKQPVIGRDVAGTIAEIGSAVTAFAVDDEVFGVAPGSVAEYAVAREDTLARRPANLTG